MKRIIFSSLLFMQALFISAVVNAQDLNQVANQKPFAINGVFGVGLGTYTSNGIDPQEHSFSYLFNGAPVISIYGISFPFNIVVSDQQRGFRQPFNQYGISPTYKWITIHAGWESVQFSQFTLAGYDILGGGVELNPGKLRLGFVYGRFNKAIEENSIQPLSFQTPTYERTGYSVKVGYGSPLNHVDLVLLNAKDDPNSLKMTPISSTLSPAENLVIGVVSKFSFFKHFVWDFDVAGSIYTRNQLDDTIPNLELDKLSFIKKLITINSSSQFLTAGQTSLSYQGKTYNLGLQYRRVDPNYQSMGAYYFETDVANYTLQGALRLFKNQLQLTGSFGVQSDNLLHDEPYTSHRDVSSLGVSFNKQKYGFDLHYSNYGITQDRGLNPIIDTFRVASTNYNLTALARYSVGNDHITHNFVLVTSIQSLVDLNHFTAGQDETNSTTGNFSYQLGFTKSAFSISAIYSYTVADIVGMHTIIAGPSIGLSKQLNDSKIGLNASFSFQQQQNNNKDAGTVFGATLNGSYRFSKRDGANIMFNYLKSNSKDITLPSFFEVRSSLNLTHSF